MSEKKRKPRPKIGWREWIALPDLGVPAVKAKIDTGARSSALHAFDVAYFEANGKEMVRFKVHPFQRDSETSIECVGELLCRRIVRTSAGHVTERPVIVTAVEFRGERWMIELTLTRRDSMGFRMLLGRQGVRRRFLVDPGRSYFGGKPSGGLRKKKKRNPS